MNQDLSRKGFLRQTSLAAAAVATGATATTATTAAATAATPAPSDERFVRGLAMLDQVDGAGGRRVMAALGEIAPDFARLLVEFAFGDIYPRPGPSLKEREIATIAALAALGNARPQLKVHINGALNVGCSRQEIVEIFMQMGVYAGFPAALNALFAAREVFQERDALPPVGSAPAPAR